MSSSIEKTVILTFSGLVLQINGNNHAVPSGDRTYALMSSIKTRSHHHEARNQHEGTYLTPRLPTQNPTQIILHDTYMTFATMSLQ